MLTKFPLQRMAAIWLTGLLLAGLILTACGGSAESTEVEKPAGSNQVEADAQSDIAEEPVQEAAQETAEETEPTAEAIEASATEEAEATNNGNLLDPAQTLPLAADPTVVCNAVDIPANPTVAAVSDSDWVKGSADALITVIEYGDFQ